MKVLISNYRGVASAELDISKICLVAGPNEAGKTSTVQALAAALTGDPIPVAGVKKTQAGMLVRSGTANGSVDLTSDTGSTSIQWPSAKVKTEGQAPFASHFATGLQSIVNLEDKERAKILSEYLKATPTRADLDEQLKTMGLKPEVLDQLWQLIETQGWDNAYAQIKEKGARYKGQWQQVTGEQYGSKKAESWIPEGYDNDLMGQSETTLQSLVTDARDALEAAIAVDAVDDSRRAELSELARLKGERLIAYTAAKSVTVDDAKLRDLESQVASGKEIIKGGEKFIREQEEKANPKADTMPYDRMHCPSCKTLLVLSGSVLKEVKTGDSVQKEVIEEAKKAIGGAKASMAKQQAILADLEAKLAEERKDYNAREQSRIGNLSETGRQLKESEQAAKELEAPAPVGSGVSVDDCRTVLATAELRHKAFKSKHEADRLHEAIGRNAELLVKIAPEGIRGDVLTRSLKGFNTSMEKFTTVAGWRKVSLESDFMPTYGGTIYLLLSESAKFRVRVVLQIGMALMDRSHALIIDAADILDKTGRNGLFKAVKASALPSLVAMTIDARELVPNLGKAGVGVSYWLNPAGEAVAI